MSKIKLLVEIDEGLYEAYKGKPPMLGDAGMDMIAQAISNGIPYEPNKDLISREALKKQFTEGAYTSKGVREIIDNAPSVHTEDCEGCPYCPNSYSGIPIGVE